MNKHSAHTLGIIALIAAVIWYFWSKAKPVMAASQDATMDASGNYIPPNQRIGVDTKKPCACNVTVAAPVARAATPVMRSMRAPGGS